MIGLDTNVLVRYLTQDDKEQAGKFQSLFINNVVLCELVWVLSRGYKYKKENITYVLRHIFSTKEFAFEKGSILWEALDEYEHNALDFSDALISRINHNNKCETSYTFDKSANLTKQFSLLKYSEK